MKEININELILYLNDLFPTKQAAEWDKVGFQIPEVYNTAGQDKIRNIVTCLDVTSDVVKFAISKNSNFIISRHPLIFLDYDQEKENPAKKALVDELIEHEIQVYTIHTNYDNSPYQSLVEVLSYQFNIKSAENALYDDYCLNIQLIKEMSLEEISNKLKLIFGSALFKITSNSDLEKNFKNFYLVSGAGCFALYKLRKIIDANFLFITGEAKWNDFVFASENKIDLLTIGHYMENYFIDDIFNKINKTFGDRVCCFEYDIKNQWKVI